METHSSSLLLKERNESFENWAEIVKTSKLADLVNAFYFSLNATWEHVEISIASKIGLQDCKKLKAIPLPRFAGIVKEAIIKGLRDNAGAELKPGHANTIFTKAIIEAAKTEPELVW